MPETKTYQTVLVERQDGIAWVTLNRPEKRNAMNPTMHIEMVEILTELETEAETQIVVITGAGQSWIAGQDIRETFREGEKAAPADRARARWASQEWRWRKLFTYEKPTIAMVNGYCFGGAFTPLIACDFAIAADEAIFGLSEINWGIFPGGLVSRVLAEAMSYREALWFILTGDPFDGKKAAELKLVNFSVPLAQLREETVKLAKRLMEKNPATLRAAKQVYKTCKNMDYWQAEEYMNAKSIALRSTDPRQGRVQGMKQFLDEKTYRPGFGAFKPDA